MNKLELIEKLNSIDDIDIATEQQMIDRTVIIDMIKLIQSLMFPRYYHVKQYDSETVLQILEETLEKQVDHAVKFFGCKNCNAKEVTQQFLQRLPMIKKSLLTDLQAIYDGDPSAKSKAEILVCYPGFYAISIYRIAHELYTLKIPYIPRVMTEFAHEKTGIDINAGATIGDYFCIDHGTGIVIGETSIIGHHVKLYQGVTIGAKSFELDEHGNPVKSGKRHPNIGNHVTIYANATILGADTTIGDGSVIGGNVWIIESVKENSKIYYETEQTSLAKL